MIDWEVTLKCNLDCSYCGSGHDNSLPHPDLDSCYRSIDFMFAYANLYLKNRPKGLKHVILNVYGGEALYYPNIDKILSRIKKESDKYKKDWNITVTSTTNLILPKKKLEILCEYIDEFTCSFHSESSIKHKNQFKENLLFLVEKGKRAKCVIVMHSDPVRFQECIDMSQWCKEHDIKCLEKQIDHSVSKVMFNYNETQIQWFNNLYQKKPSETNVQLDRETPAPAAGRPCCGGRQMCLDQNYKSRVYTIENKFPDWYCSVNEFFVYIRQRTGEIFVNKDCKMNFQDAVGPIGNISHFQTLLKWTQKNIDDNTMPVIQCKKDRCWCGLCAPKAKDKNDFNNIMKKYRKNEIPNH